MSDPVTAPVAPASEDNTVAIVAYITIIGFIVAIIMHGKNKTALGAFHLRQALGLFITWFVGSLILGAIPVIGWTLWPFFSVAMFVIAIIGLLNAVNRVHKPLPVLGSKYAEWFSGAFA